MPCKIKIATSEQNPIEIPVSPNYNTENEESNIDKTKTNEFTLNQNNFYSDISQFFPKLAKNQNSPKNEISKIDRNSPKNQKETNQIEKTSLENTNNDTNWFFERKIKKQSPIKQQNQIMKQNQMDLFVNQSKNKKENKVLEIFSEQIEKTHEEVFSGNLIKEQPKIQAENKNVNFEEKPQNAQNNTKIPIQEIIFNSQLEFYRQLQRDRMQRNLMQKNIFALFSPPEKPTKNNQKIIDLEEEENAISIESD